MNRIKRLAIDNRTDIVIKIITFIISPFLSFLYSLRTMNTRSSFVFFYLFAILFGLAFSVADDLGKMIFIDGIFYRMEFDKYCSISDYVLVNEWREYLSLKGDIKDFYFNVVAFAISRVTDNYHVMFAVFAMVFAYFQLKCLSFFVKEKNYSNCFFIMLLAYIFTWNQIFNINGVRFNTAAWIYVYCVFQLFLNNNKRYIVLLLFTPFVHAAFIVYVSFLIAVYYLKDFNRFWKFAYIVSFFVSSLSILLIHYVRAFLPDVLSRFIDSYTSGKNETSGLIDTSSISGLLLSLSTIYMNFLILWVVLKYKDVHNKKENSIYAAFVILATLMNFFSPVSSLGGRMVLMVYPLLAYVWLMCFGTKKYKWMIILFPLVMIITLRTKYQQYRMVTDTSFWFSNPISIMIKYLSI